MKMVERDWSETREAKKQGVKLHDFGVRAGDGITFWLAGCCAGLSSLSHDTNAFSLLFLVLRYRWQSCFFFCLLLFLSVAGAQ